jgi:hypothetical protein
MARTIDRSVTYEPHGTLRQARDLYFRANGFPRDGGYTDKWVRVQLGPVPLVFPNLPSRVRAVRIHDLHHIATGYHTDNAGEFEIGAWEVASGCRDYWAAWFLNLSSMAAGLFRCPVRTFRAFVRGRYTRNLYGRYDESLLERTVAELRADTVEGAHAAKATAADVASFVGWSALACALGALWFVPSLSLLALLYALLG